MSCLDSFYNRCPAFLYGVVCLLATYAILSPQPILIFPVSAVFFPLIMVSWNSRLTQRLLLALLLFAVFAVWLHMCHRLPTLPPEGIEGTGYFEMESLSKGRTHFGTQWIYKGTLQTSFCKVPCRILLPDKEDLRRPPANRSYLIEGRLKQLEKGGYILKYSRDKPWQVVKGSWSLAEMRYQAKTLVGDFLRRHIHDERSAVFLIGIITGDFDDRLMLYEFGRFGLQHIMAISGFHFAIIASIFGMILRLIFCRRTALILLLCLLSAYLLFLGSSASITRAWLSATVALAGGLFEKQGSGINSLGVALMAVLIWDPLLSQQIGFQYSFAATAAILMFFSECDRLLQKMWPKRNLKEVLEMSRFDQHGVVLLTFFRQGIALGMAVNLVTLPMMLYHFHRFPLFSILYNLFFPGMVSLSMFLLIAALLLPPFGEWLHYLNTVYTRFMLDFTYNLPPRLDVVWHVDNFGIEWLAIYLTLVIFWTISRSTLDRFEKFEI